MKSIFATRLTYLLLAGAVIAMPAARGANDDPANSAAAASVDRAAASVPPSERQWQAEAPEAANVKPHRRHPLVSFVKAVGKEVDYRLDETAKDMVFVFSAQDIDPYDQQESPPADKPYERAKIRLSDGSQILVIKFPDGSQRVAGGFADGTVLIPVAPGEFTVKYADGRRGKLIKLANDEYRVYRPDKSITTFKKQPSGKYTVVNEGLGIKSEAALDESAALIMLR
jgi:hypothetical protein